MFSEELQLEKKENVDTMSDEPATVMNAPVLETWKHQERQPVWSGSHPQDNC